MWYRIGIFCTCLISLSELQSANPRMPEHRIGFADLKKAVCFNALTDLKMFCTLDTATLQRWIDYSDEYGYTLLDYAIVGGRTAIIDILTMVPLSERTYAAGLTLATKYGYEYAIKKLLSMQKLRHVDTEEIINLRKGIHVTLQPIAEVDDNQEADSSDEKSSE